MNGLYKPEGKYYTSPNEININKSKLKTTFKPMIELDKNRNFYTYACKTNFVVEGLNTAQTTFSKRPNECKNIF